MDSLIEDILKRNAHRHVENQAPFNPITGEGSIGDRIPFVLDDFSIPTQFIPTVMANNQLVRALQTAGSIVAFLGQLTSNPTEEDRVKVVEAFIRVRICCDFPFWAASLAYIKAKGGGEDILFTLNRPQRKLIARLERMRLDNKPIRLILLKARQWGGSTAIQLYMIWLQLTQSIGLNSLIVGHVSDASTEVKDMFDRMMKSYPLHLLYEQGELFNPKSPKIEGVGATGKIHRIPQRKCKIKIGTAESPDSARGGDYNLVHLTEVGLWKTTDGKRPEQIVRSACSGVLLQPLTMIIYESTANGVGNFFHREYQAAKDGMSQFQPLFIAWWEIEQYAIPFASEEEKYNFAQQLFENRNASTAISARQESGKYLWWLFQLGATLESIHWYIQERSKFNTHGDMASEYPSDDIEAFVHSGAIVFDKYQVDALRKSARAPLFRGCLQAQSEQGEDALKGLHFISEQFGELSVWEHPEPNNVFEHRYLVAVDIGGRSTKADWSVIVVFDRLYLLDGGRPQVVAQWRGHIDHDLLAWRAAQIAAYYDHALLVIESNTLETRDRDRDVDGDQSSFILNLVREVYPNLYARPQSPEDIEQGNPKRYGFHTNTRTKPLIIAHLQKCVREAAWTERDSNTLDELLAYEKKPNGAYGAISGKHDDLLMTRAIALWICYREMELPYERKRAKLQTRYNKRLISEASL